MLPWRHRLPPVVVGEGGSGQARCALYSLTTRRPSGKQRSQGCFWPRACWHPQVSVVTWRAVVSSLVNAGEEKSLYWHQGHMRMCVGHRQGAATKRNNTQGEKKKKKKKKKKRKESSNWGEGVAATATQARTAQVIWPLKKACLGPEDFVPCCSVAKYWH